MTLRQPSRSFSLEEVQSIMEENMGGKRGTGSRKEKTNEKPTMKEIPITFGS